MTQGNKIFPQDFLSISPPLQTGIQDKIKNNNNITFNASEQIKIVDIDGFNANTSIPNGLTIKVYFEHNNTYDITIKKDNVFLNIEDTNFSHPIYLTKETSLIDSWEAKSIVSLTFYEGTTSEESK